jgi:hypothetical protein
MGIYQKQHQRACEAVRHWDKYSEDAKKRILASQKNYTAVEVIVDTEKGSTREKLAKEFGVGQKLIDAARKLSKTDPERFEKVAAGLEPLINSDETPCVYFIGHKDRFDLPIKIGKANSVTSRKSELQTAHYTELIVLFTLNGYSKLEKELHTRFSRKHVRGEWFSLTQEDLDTIIKDYS